MPWTLEMLESWFGWEAEHGARIDNARARLRIWRCGFGLYTSIDRKPASTISGVTFSSRGPNDVITDDMLAKYGFNL